MRKFLALLAVSALFACEPKEIGIDFPDSENAVYTEEVSLGSTYNYQHFYDLESRSIVKSQLKTSWHLAFDCSPNNEMIWMNDANLASISLSSESFENTHDTVSALWRYDSSSHNPDSAAVGDWKFDLNQVYILDKGFDEMGQSLGFAKFQIMHYNEPAYIIKVGDLGSFWDTTIVVEKNTDYNFVHLSISDKPEVFFAEPKKTEYDILFTQYTHYFVEEDLQYLVTGVLLNPYLVAALEDSIHGFEELDLPTAIDLLPYQTARNLIGYDWKLFNFGTNIYETDPTRLFILNSVEGALFKLRFLDFYDDQGVKGTPVFDLQKL